MPSRPSWPRHSLRNPTTVWRRRAPASAGSETTEALCRDQGNNCHRCRSERDRANRRKPPLVPRSHILRFDANPFPVPHLFTATKKSNASHAKHVFAAVHRDQPTLDLGQLWTDLATQRHSPLIGDVESNHRIRCRGGPRRLQRIATGETYRSRRTTPKQTSGNSHASIYQP
jgi:hypothetical protein